MAKHVLERIVDDVDGTDATITVRLGWNGEWRELDLNEKNGAALAKAVDKYWNKGRAWAPQPNRARTTPTSRRRPTATRQGQRDYDLADLRQWAARNNIAVPSRGR